jgi:hypothetical protein
MVQLRVKTAVMAAARENRSLSSCMLPSRVIMCWVLDIAVGISRRCAAGPVRAGPSTSGASIPRSYARLNPLRSARTTCEAYTTLPRRNGRAGLFYGFCTFLTCDDRSSRAAPSMDAHDRDATTDVPMEADHRRDASKGDHSSAVAGLHIGAHSAAADRSTGCAAAKRPERRRSLQGLLTGSQMPTGMQNQRRRAQQLRPLSSTCYLPRRCTEIAP